MADDPATPAPSDPVDPPAGDPPTDPPVDPPAKTNGSGDPPSAAAPSADDWRASIQDEKLRDHAGRFTSIIDVVAAHHDLRTQLATAIQPLPKDPTDEQVVTFRKTSGIPETVEGYEFAAPEGHEVTDADKAFQAAAAEAFHGLNITSEQGKGLNEWWNAATAAALQTQIDGDKAYADESEAALKKEWPGEEFARNKQHAEKAAAKLFGDELDEVRNIETKDGRFILDHAAFVKMLAQYGREMAEPKGERTMTDSDRDDNQAQIDALEKRIEKAKAENDRSTANTLYIEQQELYRKSYGAGPVVGAEGRMA